MNQLAQVAKLMSRLHWLFYFQELRRCCAKKPVRNSGREEREAQKKPLPPPPPPPPALKLGFSAPSRLSRGLFSPFSPFPFPALSLFPSVSVWALSRLFPSRAPINFVRHPLPTPTHLLLSIPSTALLKLPPLPNCDTH